LTASLTEQSKLKGPRAPDWNLVLSAEGQVGEVNQRVLAQCHEETPEHESSLLVRTSMRWKESPCAAG
jgi:hypothetical protein